MRSERTAKDKLVWRSVQLQKRDISILKMILEQKFLTLGQVHRAFFSSVSLQMVRLRLRKLAHFRMIETRRVYTEAGQIYVLGPAGYRCLETRGLSRELGLLSEIDLRVFEHDKAVTDLRLALESGALSWKSERELRRERPGRRVPDAVFRLSSGSIALEFENADKGIERYRAIFMDHLTRPLVEHVLYVLRASDKVKSLCQILAGLQDRHLGIDIGRISFAREKEVIDRKFEAVAVNVSRGDVRLANLCEEAGNENETEANGGFGRLLAGGGHSVFDGQGVQKINSLEGAEEHGGF